MCGGLCGQSLRFDKNVVSADGTHLFVDKNPKSVGAWFTFAFNELEKIEPLAVIVSELYHLTHGFIEPYLPTPVYKEFSNLHKSADNILYVLHPIHFFSTVTLILRGAFIVKIPAKKSIDKMETIDKMQTSARVSHFIADFFFTSAMAIDLQLISMPLLGRAVIYAPHLNALGCFISLIDLICEINKRNKRKKLHHIPSLAIMDITGIVAQLGAIAKTAGTRAPLLKVIQKMSSLAMIIFKAVVMRLTLFKTEKYNIKDITTLPVKVKKHE